MIKQPRAVVVIPTRNERETIVEIVSRVLDQQQHVPFAELHVLVVDGDSTDGTIEHVEAILEQDPRVHLLVLAKRGLGLALLEAYKYSVRELDPTYIAQMDADLSHDPEKLPELLDALSRGYDLAIGSRYVEGGGTPGWPRTRRLQSLIANGYIRYITGYRELREWTSGYRAFTVDLYRRLDLQAISYDDYTVQPALVHAALVAGASVREVPIMFVNRRWGRSKLPLFRYTSNLLRHFLVARFRTRATGGQAWPARQPD